MNKFLRFSVYFWFVVMVQACVHRWAVNEISYTKIAAGSNIQHNVAYDSLIAPYRHHLEDQMNEVIGSSLVEMPKQKDQPETLLGNFVADLVFETVTETLGLQADACLLNIGGLRASLPQGNITRGNIFSLAPFENEVVLVEVHPNVVNKFLFYLSQKPQPIAGFTLNITPDGIVKELGGGLAKTKESYIIITSDYLANGGDNMDFFKESLGKVSTGIKLRDMIIDFIKMKKEIQSKLDQRIQITQ